MAHGKAARQKTISYLKFKDGQSNKNQKGE